MLFTSLVFWPFLAVFALCFFLTRGNVRLWVCLLGSYFFYGWWDWRFVGLIAFLTVVNYQLGLWIDGAKNERKRRACVIASVVVCLGVLAFFKYAGFVVASLNWVLKPTGLGNLPEPLDFASFPL